VPPVIEIKERDIITDMFSVNPYPCGSTWILGYDGLESPITAVNALLEHMQHSDNYQDVEGVPGLSHLD